MDIPQQNHGGVVYCCRQCCKTPLFDHHANNLGGRVSRKVFWGENVSEASLWLLPFLSWVYNHNRKTAELSVHCNLHFNCCHTNRVTMTGPFLLAIFLFLLGFSPQSQKKKHRGRLCSLSPLSGACAHERSILLQFTEGWISRHNNPQLLLSSDIFPSKLQWERKQRLRPAVRKQRAVLN